MDRRRLTGVLLVVVSALAFGSGALFAKPVYGAGLDWLTLLVWRFGFGASLAWLWLLASPVRRSAFRSTSRRQIAAGLGLGAVYSLNSGTYYAALETVSASLASLIVYIYPVLVAVLALRFGRPLAGRRPWIALAIATLGVILAVGGIDPGHLPPVGGIALAVASPIIYSGWIILSARLGGERRDRAGDDADGGAGAAVASALMMTVTGAVFLALALASAHPIAPAAIPGGAWPGLLGIGIVSTFVAIQTFYGGARRIGAAQAALISTIEPAYTIAMAGLLFGERLTAVQLVGGGLILGAVVLAQSSSRAADVAPELRISDE